MTADAPGWRSDIVIYRAVEAAGRLERRHGRGKIIWRDHPGGCLVMADDDADRIITYVVGKLVNAAWIIAWFIARTVFYLVIFLVLLLGEGVLALTRKGSHPPGAGEYSPDGLYWNDRTSGKRYEVHPTEKEYCEVQGAERGQYLRQTALSRFMRQPAILRCQFAANIDGTERVAGSVTFPRACAARHQALGRSGPGDGGTGNCGYERSSGMGRRPRRGRYRPCQPGIDSRSAGLGACGLSRRPALVFPALQEVGRSLGPPT